METLYLIPARGGSKGLPGKNIKDFNGKPLIYYSIDVARELTDDDHICVSTDSDEIIDIVERYGLAINFKRPKELATDEATTFSVIKHALDFYKTKGITYDRVMLLQPTSPLRLKTHLEEVQLLYNNNPNVKMVVSVKKSKDSPYFNLFEKNSLGFLEKSKPSSFSRRQDAPPVFAYNGSIYLFGTKYLDERVQLAFDKILPYLMEDKFSIDIDTELDWLFAETIIKTPTSEKQSI